MPAGVREGQGQAERERYGCSCLNAWLSISAATEAAMCEAAREKWAQAQGHEVEVAAELAEGEMEEMEEEPAEDDPET